MTDEELIENVRVGLGDERFERYIPYHLMLAKKAVVERMWPCDPDKTWEDVPERHHATACEITVYLVNRRGAEGETSHSESGTSRSYESAGVPDSLLRGIVPHVGVPR
ncbi:phage head-tail connector protein [Adlercreutzia sp. R25]|uniref:phage head-tail connector protein n=1 Tax=Adlercreutzia shanghongiae TaxID=3111773 RepID=UPI002DC0513E|nr:phage head-tail connector protein [Adlercreutzia sp. R25]MEC4272957.1 phage head-tail connector protein [Adlercreutzia sp. R25]